LAVSWADRTEGVAPARKASNAEKIVGVWLIATDQAKAPVTLNFPVEFTKEGKVEAVLGLEKSSPRSRRGTYQIKGDTMHITFLPEGKSPVHMDFVIKRLTTEELELTYDEGKKTAKFTRPNRRN